MKLSYTALCKTYRRTLFVTYPVRKTLPRSEKPRTRVCLIESTYVDDKYNCKTASRGIDWKFGTSTVYYLIRLYKIYPNYKSVVSYSTRAQVKRNKS